jgi:dihydrofolate reductase
VTIALIAAVARNDVIGRDGGIPWHLPEDVARFKERTAGHAVVMGRKTWDSLPDRYRPLPGRRNVVVTRDPDWAAHGAERVGSFSEARGLLADEERVCVIGGAEIYAAALPFADELELTEVGLVVDGDTRFPTWERKAFDVVDREEHVAADGTAFAFVTYRRWGAGAAGQLAALAEVAAQLERDGIAYWLFGGWAVDFHAGRITRPHEDIDIAVWRDDEPRIAALLAANGWDHAPEPDEDGGTGYERGGVRLELTYLVRRDGGLIAVPLRDLDAAWPDGAFEADERSLDGVSAHVIALEALKHGKSSARDDAGAAEKDAVDADVLSGL